MKRERLSREKTLRKGNPNWKPGMAKVPGSGRVKGQPNNATRDIKQAVMQAAGEIGDEWEPGTGLVGYMKKLEQRKPEAFARLVAMMLPLTIRREDGADLKQIDAKTSPQDAARAYVETLRAPPTALPGKTIDHEPLARPLDETPARARREVN